MRQDVAEPVTVTLNEPSSHEIGVNENKIMVLITPTCPYCQYILPLIEQAKKKYEAQVTFEIIDISKGAQQYKSKFKFRTVPMVIYYKDGQEELRHESNDKTITFGEIAENIKKVYHL